MKHLLKEVLVFLLILFVVFPWGILIVDAFFYMTFGHVLSGITSDETRLLLAAIWPLFWLFVTCVCLQ